MDENEQLDHVGRLLVQRRKESPDIPLDGMAIFARARRLDALSRKWIEPIFDRFGIDAGEFDVLGSIQRAGPPYAVRPTELYQTLLITSGGLTTRLARLQKKKFVERVPCPNDGRSLLVRLTPKGLDLIRKAYALDMAVEKSLLKSLDDNEITNLSNLLAKLLRSLEESQP